MATIYYFCPDFPQPSGGIKTLYRHVWRLNQMGIQAAIVHQKHGFTIDWHQYDVPILWLEDRPPFTPKDVWVFPEVMTDTVRKTSHFGGTRVVFALSWLPSYSRLRPGERWQDHGIEHVITKSPAIQRHLAWSMEVEATLIPEFVDPKLYYVAHEQDKSGEGSGGQREKKEGEDRQEVLRICYATRKDQSGPWLQGVLSRRDRLYKSCEWTALREMDEATYAHHLREAHIYVVTTMQEGMHVSVLEAMACGCLVIGYSGIGGADYMVSKGITSEGTANEGVEQNCILVENGNLLALGQKLEDILSANSGLGPYQSIINNGRATAQQFQKSQLEGDALTAFYGPLIAQ